MGGARLRGLFLVLFLSSLLRKGFAEEERDEQNRRKRARAALSAWGTKQDSEFNFGSIKAHDSTKLSSCMEGKAFFVA